MERIIINSTKQSFTHCKKSWRSTRQVLWDSSCSQKKPSTRTRSNYYSKTWRQNKSTTSCCKHSNFKSRRVHQWTWSSLSLSSTRRPKTGRSCRNTYNNWTTRERSSLRCRMRRIKLLNWSRILDKCRLRWTRSWTAARKLSNKWKRPLWRKTNT